MKKNWETYQEKLILKSATPYLLLYAIFVFILLMGLILLNWGKNTYNQAVEPNSPIQTVAHLPINTDKPSRTIKAIVTAYNPEVGQCDETPFVTANGSPVSEQVAACPRALKFGTLIEINGEKYICQDRMALKNEGKFDLFKWNKNEAIAFGKKSLTVKIYE